MLTETLNVSEAELGQSEPEGSDLRYVSSIDATTPLLISPREDNTREEPQHQISLPLWVELTGYRLLMTGIILGLGIPKAVYSYSGQSLISTTLDWVAGIVLALM
jgi:hypothetical protein